MPHCVVTRAAYGFSGGSNASGDRRGTKRSHDVDDDLEIDLDESQVYGPAQYAVSTTTWQGDSKTNACVCVFSTILRPLAFQDYGAGFGARTVGRRQVW